MAKKASMMINQLSVILLLSGNLALYYFCYRIHILVLVVFLACQVIFVSTLILIAMRTLREQAQSRQELSLAGKNNKLLPTLVKSRIWR